MAGKGELVVLTQVSGAGAAQTLIVPNDSDEYLVNVHTSAAVTIGGTPTVTVFGADGATVTSVALLATNRYGGFVFGDDKLCVFFRDGTVSNLSPKQTRHLLDSLGPSFSVTVSAPDAGVTSTLRVTRRPNVET